MKPGSSSPEERATANVAEHEAALPALAWMRRAGAEEELLAEIAQAVRRRRRRGLVFASGTLAALLVAGFIWSSEWRQLGATARSASTTATLVLPERRALPDGSVVELKPGAEIAVDFGGGVRRVALRRGEAHFQVAKDAARPFVVAAAGIEARALGTAFSVQLEAKHVEVLVTEGQVQLAALPDAPRALAESAVRPGAAGDSPAAARAAPILTAGHHAVVALDDPAPRIATVSPAEIAERLGWRIPSLEFSRTPLAEVVGHMNRLAAEVGGPRFTIASPELRELKLSGFLRADNAEGLVRLLENNFNVKAERAGATITLRSAP